MNILSNETNYDVRHIEKVAKRRFALLVVTNLLLAVFSIIGALVVIFYGEHVAAFLGGAAATVISLYILIKKVKRFDASTLRSTVGKISDIDVQIRTERQIAGGVGLRERRYDNYKKQTTSVGVFIDDGESVHPYYIHKATNAQVEYYRCKANVIHIFATRFPVKTNEDNEEWFCSVCKTKNIGKDSACRSCRCHKNRDWLCPICGDFNKKGDTSCASCKTRIMKKADYDTNN